MNDNKEGLFYVKNILLMYIKLLLYFKTKQLVGSNSLHGIILGDRNVLHGSGKFMIADIKCETFFFKTYGCQTLRNPKI